MGIRKQALGVAGGVAGGAGLFTGGVAVGRLLRLDSQRGDYRHAWEDHDLATLALLGSLGPGTEDAERPYVIVALGDSATQGLGASHVEEGYVPRLASAIQEALGRPVALLNISMSGATSESVVVTQLPQLRGLDLAGRGFAPDLLVLNVGGNDVSLADQSIESFGARIETICSELPAGSLIGNISSFGILRSEPRAAEMSDLLSGIALDHGHHVVDLRGRSQEHSMAKYTFGYHAADLFHPNSAAYADWAQCFADEWARATEHDEIDVSQAPGWKMASSRVAQSRS